jgi:uncharacterized repeat protein (TIGR01451 family)
MLKQLFSKTYWVLTAVLLASAAWMLTPAQAAWAGCGDTNPTVLCVDADATGGATGLSWTNAFTNVQDALDVTNANGTTDYEIWVAEGVYYPDEGGSTLADSEAMSFTLSYNNVQLYGGFVATETTRSQRDWETYVTVLSGDIDADAGGADTTDANGVVTDTDNISGTNAYHVLWLDGVTNETITETTVIDGFTITAGQADDNSHPHESGGGLYCAGDGSGSACSPTLTNVTFSGNWAHYWDGVGGGMFNYGEHGASSPTLTNVTFSGNRAEHGGGMFNQGTDGESSPSLTNVTFNGNQANGGGGGMVNDGSDSGESSPALTNVTFNGNRAGTSGGGMVNDGIRSGESSPVLTNVTFSGNQAGYNGGGMLNQGTVGGESSPVLTNVTFSGNWADDSGGGMFNQGTDGESSPVLTNVTFSGNQVDVWSGGGMYNQDSSPTLTNVILWGNTKGTLGGGNQLSNVDTTLVLSYTLIQSGTGHIHNHDSTVTYGDGILTSDPQFVAPITATAAPTTTGDYRLQAGSPVIDAGDDGAINATGVTTDLDGNPRIFGDAVDLGAYEAQPNLALRKTVTPTTDVTHHGAVTYTVVLSNSGVLSDTNVLFTDTLPISTTFGAWVISPTHTSLDSDEITWTGTVTAGDTFTWTWIVTHTGDYGDVVTNTAEFSGTLQAGEDDAVFTVVGPPEITVHPSSLSFGSQDVDAGPTLSQTVTITNDGSADLQISAVTPTGDTGEFNLADSGEGTLTPGSTRTIEVSFDPTSAGAKSATLTIQSDDSDEPTMNVDLSGTGTEVSQPGYDSNPAPDSAIDVGTDNVGSTVTATLTISETGEATLMVTPTLVGPDAADFDVTPSTLTIPDAVVAQDLTIACRPSVTGTLAATLTVAHNATGSPALYPLSCTGEAYAIYLPLVLR